VRIKNNKVDVVDMNYKMKKPQLVCLLIILTLNAVYAQTGLADLAPNGEEQYFAVNGGLGMSDLLIRGSSYGLFADAHFLFMPNIALGIKSGINFSTDGIVFLEAQFYARWYYLHPELRLGFFNNNINLFLQGGIGMLGAFRGIEAQNTRSSFLFDVTVGVAIPIVGNWNIEPSVRFGYPFIAGFTITAGYRFPLRQTTVYRDREIPPNEIIRKIMISSVEYIIFAPNISIFNEGLDANTRNLNDLIINQVAQILREHPEFLVRVEGHANPVTNNPNEANELYTLSTERANEIASLLITKGVKQEQIVIIAYGGERVITSSQEDWSRNRRVELIVIQIDTNDAN